MTQLIGIPGSLRQASYNKALLQAASQAMPAESQLTIASLHGIPLYDGDLESAEGIPSAVETLKNQLAAADGLVLASPEYNGGMPGVMKNALDWLSRPPGDQSRVLHGKPVLLMGATPGGTGTASAQAHWLPVLRSLRLALWVEGGAMTVPRAGQAFDAEGQLIDIDIRDRLTGLLAGFVVHINEGQSKG